MAKKPSTKLEFKKVKVERDQKGYKVRFGKIWRRSQGNIEDIKRVMEERQQAVNEYRRSH